MRLKYTASLMIYLILSLMIVIPMQVSGFTVSLTGKNGIPDVRQTTDITKLAVIADSQVSLKATNGQTYDMTCENKTTYFQCDYTFSENTLEAGSHEITLNQENGEPQTINKEFYVDDQSPIIQSITKQIITEGTTEKLNLSMKLMDETFGMTEDSCGGISRISLTADSNVIYENQIPTHTCNYDFQKIISIPNIEGETNLAVSITDGLNQITTEDLGTISIDTKAPRIQTDSLKIYQGDKEVTKIADSPESAPMVKVSLLIEETNLSEVRLNATELSQDPNVFPQYNNILMNCHKQEEMNLCEADNLELLPATNHVNLTITAKDQKGNEETKHIIKTFQIVNSKGEITYFNPPVENCDETTCYLKKGFNKLEVKINHDEGIVPELIHINPGNINNNQITRLHDCNQTGNTYDCHAYLILNNVESGQTSRIVLASPSTDVNGNKLKGITKTIVTIDADKPELITKPRLSELCPTAGMKTILNLTVKDNTSSKLFINVKTNKTTNGQNFTNECKAKNNKEFNCEVSLENFVNYPEQENISIEVRDLAGNKLNTEIPLEVCLAETEVAPETIRSISTSTNQKINKRIATITPVKIYLSLTFNIQPTIAKQTAIFALDAGNCLGTDYLAGEPYFLNEDTFVRTQDDKTNRGEAILVVPIGKQIIQDDEVKISCNISIYEKVKNTRYTLPEKQSVEVTIPTYENPLGTVDQASAKQLKQIKTEITDLQKGINTRMKINEVFEKICWISNMLGKVTEAVSIAQSALYLVALAVNIFGGSGEGVWQAVCNPVKGFMKGKKKVKKDNFWNNAKTILKQTVNAGCTLYHCGLCTVEGQMMIANFAFKGANAYAENRDAKAKAAESTGASTEKNEDVNSDSSSFTAANKDSSFNNNPISEQEFLKTFVNLNDGVGVSEQELNDYYTYLTNNLNDEDLMKALSTDGNHMKDKEVEIRPSSTDDDFRRKAKQSDTSTWIIDPYKSKKYASICMCNSGMIFAMNKEKQLKCREYKCIKNAVEQGLPTYTCQKDYAVGSCLYVQGAISKKTILKQLWEGIKNSILSDPIRTARMVVCIDDYIPSLAGKLGSELSNKAGCTLEFGWRNVFCDLTDAYIHLRSLKNLQNPFKKQESQLAPPGEDFCAGIDMGDLQ